MVTINALNPQTKRGWRKQVSNGEDFLTKVCSNNDSIEGCIVRESFHKDDFLIDILLGFHEKNHLETFAQKTLVAFGMEGSILLIYQLNWSQACMDSCSSFLIMDFITDSLFMTEISLCSMITQWHSQLLSKYLTQTKHLVTSTDLL